MKDIVKVFFKLPVIKFPRDTFSSTFSHTSLADVVPLPLPICSVLVRMMFALYSIVL